MDSGFRVVKLPISLRLPVAGRPAEDDESQAVLRSPEDFASALLSERGTPSDGGWRRNARRALVTLALLAMWVLPRSAPERGALAALAATVILLSSRRIRYWVSAARDRRLLRRDWEIACRRAGLVNREGRVPSVATIRAVPAGERLLVRVPAGRSVTELAAGAESLAKGLGVRELRVDIEPDRIRTAHVTLIRRDPLAGHAALRWPMREREQTSLWERVPVGVDEEGRALALSLVGRNLLIGGDAGSGKSTALSLPLAAAALDPKVELSLLDGKRVGFAPLRACATNIAGPDLDDAIALLLTLQTDLHHREQLLGRLEQRRFEPTDDVPLHVLACEELDDYLRPDDPGGRRRRQFLELIIELADRGRAAGIIVLATLREPSATILPSALRDAFRYRCVLGDAADPKAEAVLGRCSSVYFAHVATATASAPSPGVGYLLDLEHPSPVRLRWFTLADDDLHGIQRRARILRAAWTELHASWPDVSEESGKVLGALGP